MVICPKGFGTPVLTLKLKIPAGWTKMLHLNQLTMHMPEKLPVYSLHGLWTIFGLITTRFDWGLKKTSIVLCSRLYLTFQKAHDLPNYIAFFFSWLLLDNMQNLSRRICLFHSFCVLCAAAAHTNAKLSSFVISSCLTVQLFIQDKRLRKVISTEQTIAIIPRFFSLSGKTFVRCMCVCATPAVSLASSSNFEVIPW